MGFIVFRGAVVFLIFFFVFAFFFFGLMFFSMVWAVLRFGHIDPLKAFKGKANKLKMFELFEK